LIAVTVLFGVFVKSEKYDVTTTIRIGSGMVGTEKPCLNHPTGYWGPLMELLFPA
jgi:hypothetical protein